MYAKILLHTDIIFVSDHRILTAVVSVITMVVVFQRMNVVVKPGLPMLMSGSCSPCVAVSVSAIGVTDTADKNKEHSAKIFEFLTRELSLNEDR